MSELDYITVRGFKSIESIEKLEIGPLTVLIGPNGSGKSNFLGVFSFLNAIREGRLREYVIKAGGADKVLHFGSRVTKQLHIHLSFEEGKNEPIISLLSRMVLTSWFHGMNPCTSGTRRIPVPT